MDLEDRWEEINMITSTYKSFTDWLLSNGYNKNTADSVNSRVNRLNEEYSIEHEFERDGCADVLSELTYTTEDQDRGLLPKTSIIIDGNYVTGLRSLKKALSLYVDYLKAIGYIPAVKKSATPGKCIFRGNFSQFNKFIGPCLRNKVPVITRSIKKKVGSCECCGKTFKLQAAHKHGFERLEIIKNLLNSYYKVSEDLFEVDLEDFESKFIATHIPYEKVFYFLCADCHRQYDDMSDPVASNQVAQAVLKSRSACKKED